MAYLRFCYALCFLYLISLNAIASTATNVVPISGGGTANLVGVTSINKANGTAGVVIDGRDRFGNSVRLNKTARFSPTKLRGALFSCVTSPARCAASVALTAALGYYGYTIISEEGIFKPAALQQYPDCVTRQNAGPNGDINGRSALGPIPCVIGFGISHDLFSYTFNESMSPLPDWGINQATGLPYGVTLIEGDEINQTYTQGMPLETVNIDDYYRIVYPTNTHARPTQSAPQEALSESLATDIMLSDPARLQVSPGVYPDIFEPLDITVEDDATSIDFDTKPETETNNTGEQEPEYEEMILLDESFEKTVDISSYFNWGASWLPKTCPNPATLAVIHGQHFDFNYSTLCNAIETYLSPFIKFAAILSFLNILMGGIRD